MRSMERRLRTLEAANRESGWGPVLDTLSCEDLGRLESVMAELADDAGRITESAVLALSGANTLFLENLLKMKGDLHA